MSKITTTLSGINPQPRNKREEQRNWQKLSALFLGAGDVTLTPNGNISIGCNLTVHAPSYLIVTGNPGGTNLLTSVSGTLTLASATQSQSTFFAAGATASGLTPAFRLITATDLAASPGAGTILTSSTTGTMTWAAAGTGGGMTLSLGTANGLSLTGSTLSLAAASTSTTGALTSTDWNTFNGKQNALSASTVATIGTLSLTSLLIGSNALGQLVSTTIASGSAVSLTTATPANIGSLTLSAGLWDITGVVDYVLTAATTTDFKSGAALVSATFGPQDSFVNIPLITSLLSDTFGHVLPTIALDNRTVGTTTPVYLVGQASFSVGAATAYGTIRARRVG